MIGVVPAEEITREPIRRVTVELFVRVREEAQGLVEYGLIIALVAVLAIAGLIVFGPAVSKLLSNLGGSV
jgi:Flp pilus assembly pilin Flp